ncbi:MAG: hypothetical protein U0936_03845 [Planctomycetaceae bacterium]
MEVPLELADDGKTIHAIEAEADPRTIIMGSVIGIDAATGTIIVETEDVNDTLIKVPLTIDGKAVIEVDGKRSELGSVLPRSGDSSNHRRSQRLCERCGQRVPRRMMMSNLLIG